MSSLIAVFPAIGVLASFAQESNFGAISLTNAAQVRRLSATNAAESIPVHLRGVVITEAGPTDQAAVIWDGTAGIYLLAATRQFSGVQRGDVLETSMRRDFAKAPNDW